MKMPFTVKFIESVMKGVCEANLKVELVRNAKLPFEDKGTPADVRDFWVNRIYTHWDEYRKAWVICDNFEYGVSSLCYYPENERWSYHRYMAEGEANLTHEEAEEFAKVLYRLPEHPIQYFR